MSDQKNYVMTFDESLATFEVDQLHSFIRDHKLVTQWCTPFKGTYFIKTSKPLIGMHRSFARFFQQCSFFLAEVSPRDSAGIMLPEIWDWFNEGILPRESIEHISKNRLEVGSEKAKKFLESDD